MSPRLKPWVGLSAASAGLALALASPIAAALVTFAAYLYALFTTFALNVPLSRVATRLAGVAYAAGIYLATQNEVLAGGALAMVIVGWPPIEIWARVGQGKGFDLQSIVAFAIGVGTLLLAGRPETASLVFAPIVLWNAFGALAALTSVRGTWPFTPDGMAIAVGAPMPDFELPARGGRPTFKLAEQRGSPILLCFLRGDWCPICQVMMRIFMKEAPRLAEHGVTLVAVSPTSGDSAEAFFAEMGLDYVVLIDERAKLAGRFGLLEGERGGEPYPLPVSLLIDAEGILRYVSRPHDFSAFDDRSKVLAVLDAGPVRTPA